MRARDGDPDPSYPPRVPGPTFAADISLTARCGACGKVYDLTGLRDVTEVDATFEASVTLEGPCPACAGPDDGGGSEVVAAG